MRAPYADAWPRTVDACLTAECARWQNLLGWDVTRDWQGVVPAWRAGHVAVWCRAGAHAADASWAFAVPTPQALQIGAVIAPDAGRYAALVQAISDTAETVLGFVREQRESDADAWRRMGCRTDRSVYLVATTTTDHDEVGRPLDPATDRASLAALFRDAYRPSATLRAFAPGGTLDEWAAYVEGLLTRPGCGDLAPDSSIVCEGGEGLVAACLVSTIGPAMAHLPQVVVAPSAAGRGLGRRLLRAARAHAGRHLGCSAVSLIVSESNTRALELYGREGFRPRGAFLTLRRG